MEDSLFVIYQYVFRGIDIIGMIVAYYYRTDTCSMTSRQRCLISMYDIGIYNEVGRLKDSIIGMAKTKENKYRRK